MIKNIVFDFGQVLVHFEPAYMVSKYVSDADDKRLIESVIFDRLYWDRLDDGTITDDELIAASKTRLPERLWGVAEEIYRSWIYNLPEMEGMRELIAHIKNDLGAPLYLLSNISASFAEHSEEIDILRPFDKCIFSAVYGVVKPSRDIYDILCRECGILPEETLFIDDSQKNIDGARAAGISGYLFDGDTARLGAYIDGIFKKS